MSCVCGSDVTDRSICGGHCVIFFFFVGWGGCGECLCVGWDGEGVCMWDRIGVRGADVICICSANIVESSSLCDLCMSFVCIIRVSVCVSEKENVFLSREYFCIHHHGNRGKGVRIKTRKMQ